MAFVVERKRRRKKRRRRRRGKHHRPATSTPTPRPPSPTPAPTPAEPAPAGPDPQPPQPSTGPIDPDAWPRTIPSAYELLLLNRFGQGYTPDAFARLRTAGGAEVWFDQQLEPDSISENPKVASIDSWFAHLWKSPKDKYADHKAEVKPAWRYGHEFGNWTLLRRIYSHRSLLEAMTAFWSDVLHIPVGHDYAWPYRFDYDATIRTHALGSFEDLLLATALHPAMRAYLDNWTSKAGKPNENQGRELLELHTVTRAAGYTEAMVKSSAKILSGYTIDWKGTFDPRYDPDRHTTGPVTVLGFSHPNSAKDGQAVTVAYLKYLARHPETARTVARRLATAFVGDHPPDSLVDKLAAVFTSSGTSIAATLRALVASPEFASSHGAKVRTPYADLVATTRVLGVEVSGPDVNSGWINAANWLHGAIPVFSWPRPDGSPLTNAAWCSASRMFRSYEMHLNLAGGWWPKEATYVDRAAWLPKTALPFSQFVDHLCRVLLGRAATDKHQQVAAQAVGVSGTATIDARHAVARWLFPHLAIALLDAPDHLST